MHQHNISAQQQNYLLGICKQINTPWHRFPLHERSLNRGEKRSTPEHDHLLRFPCDANNVYSKPSANSRRREYLFFKGNWLSRPWHKIVRSAPGRGVRDAAEQGKGKHSPTASCRAWDCSPTCLDIAEDCICHHSLTLFFLCLCLCKLKTFKTPAHRIRHQSS